MTRFSILAIFLTLVCIGTVSAQSVAYNDADAYEVYAAIILKEWPIKIANASRVVIQQETTVYPHMPKNEPICLKPAKGEEAVYDPVIRSYLEVNKRTWLLQRKFGVAIPYDIVPSAEINSLFATKNVEGWKDFYAKYPDSKGYITMSAVGFNSEKTIAIVYMGHSCGGLCGGGRYHVLKKTEGKWAEISWNGAYCSWAS